MKRIFIATLLSTITCQAFASFLTDTPRLFVAAGAGDMFYGISGTSHTGTGPGWPNDVYNVKSIANQPYGFVAAGYAWQRQSNWLPGFDLAAKFMYVPNASVTGYVDQFSLPMFRNYAYSFDVNMLSLLALFKVSIFQFQNLLPFVVAGAGVTTYGTSNYKEQTEHGITPRTSPGFNDGSGNNITYQLGLGIDYAVNNCITINLEYDYINFGNVSTGKGLNYDETINNAIKATTLFLGATYYVS